MLFWSNGSLTFNIIFCQRYYSLRSWRYCLGARLKFWQRSHNPKKGVGTRRLKYIFLAAYALLTASPPNLTRPLHNTDSYAG